MSYKSYINQALQDIYKKQQQQGYGQGYQGGGGYGGLMQRPAETFGGAQLTTMPTGGYGSLGGYTGQKLGGFLNYLQEQNLPFGTARQPQTSVVSEALNVTQDGLDEWMDEFRQQYPGMPLPPMPFGVPFRYTGGMPGEPGYISGTGVSPTLEEWQAYIGQNPNRYI